MEARYSLLQVISVLSQLKSRGDITPLLLVLSNLNSAKENEGYTFEEVDSAYSNARLETKKHYETLYAEGDEGAKNILDYYDRSLGFNMRQAFDFLLEYRTTNEKVRDLINASDMTLDQMVSKSKEVDPKGKGIVKASFSYYKNLRGGEIKPETLEILAKIFEVNVDYLKEPVKTDAFRVVKDELTLDKMEDREYRESEDIKIQKEKEYFKDDPMLLSFLNSLRSLGYSIGYKESKRKTKKSAEKLINDEVAKIEKLYEEQARLEERKKTADEYDLDEIYADLEAIKYDIQEAKKELYYKTYSKKAFHVFPSDEVEFIKTLDLKYYKPLRREYDILISTIEAESARDEEQIIQIFEDPELPPKEFTKEELIGVMDKVRKEINTVVFGGMN